MKRNDVLKKIVKTLQPWESSKLDKKCANEILSMLEELDIICPPPIIVDKVTIIDDNGVKQVLDVEECIWEK